MLLVRLRLPAPSISARFPPVLIWSGVLVLVFFSSSGIVAEEADHSISFESNRRRHRTLSSSSVSSVFERAEDPFDFGVYMDKVYVFPHKIFSFEGFFGWLTTVTQAPLAIRNNSPLELVQQFFVKLGARYVVVTDANGYCKYLILPPDASFHLEQSRR
jgi:hypothetical protein